MDADKLIEVLETTLEAARTGDLTHLVLIARTTANGGDNVMMISGDGLALHGMVAIVHRKLAEDNYRTAWPPEERKP